MWLNLAQVPCGVAVSLFYLEIHTFVLNQSNGKVCIEINCIVDVHGIIFKIVAQILSSSFLSFYHIYNHTSIHVALNFKNMYYYDQSVH